MTRSPARMMGKGHISVKKYLDDRFQDVPSGRRLLHGAAWNVLGSVFSRICALVTTVITARMLGKEGFGELGMIQSSIIMLGVLAGFGSGLSATKYVSEHRLRDPERAGQFAGASMLVAVLFGFLGAGILYLLAPIMAKQVLSADHLASLLQASAIYVFLSTMNGAQIGVLSGLESFKELSRINLIAGIAGVCIVASCVTTYGMQGAVWGYNLAMAVNCTLSQYVLHKVMREHHMKLDYIRSHDVFGMLWKYNLPAMLASALVAFVTWMCNAMLVNQPTGYESLGLYHAAYQWRQVLLFLPSMIAQVTLPIMSSDRDDAMSDHVRTNFRLNVIIAFPLLLVLCLISPFIMNAYGQSFRHGWLVFAIVQIATFFQVLQSPIATYWAATGRMWTNFLMNIGWAAVLVALSRYLLHLGALGLALSLFASFFLHGFLLLLFVPRANAVRVIKA